MFETIIDITLEIKDEVDKIAQRISQIDSTFTYKIQNDCLIIYSDDRNKAIKRGMWWFYKVSDKVGKKLHFNVFKV